MMISLRFITARIQRLFKGASPDEDLNRETSTDRTFPGDECRERSLPVAEGMIYAQRDYAGSNQAKRSQQSVRVYAWLVQATRDIRFAFRQLRRAPGFTIAAVLTLALGIGANTAVFSVVNAVLLKPLGYPDPDRIVRFLLISPHGSTPGASIPDYRLWLDHTSAFQDISAYDFGEIGIGLTDLVPEQVHAIHVTFNYFRLFGAPIFLGRTFIKEEDTPHGAKVVVISYGLWARKYGKNRNIIGKTISLENEPYTVVGVTGQRFQTDPATDLWIPFQFDLNSSNQLHYFTVAGRIKPGLTLAQANAQLKLISQEAHPDADPNLQFKVQQLRDAIVRNVRSSLVIMLGAVSFVLLIACANFANLLLVRATVRAREFAVRASIGASRGRIIAQLITESVILSLIGGTLGLSLGFIGVRLLLSLSQGNIPRIGESGTAVHLDGHVLMFTLCVSLITGVLFGLFPALSVSQRDIRKTLSGSGSGQGAGLRGNRTRSLLVIGEISLSVVLLIGASLLIRTFVALREVKPGFDHQNVLILEMSLKSARFDQTSNVSGLVNDARHRLDTTPGVQISAATCCPPFAARMGMSFTVGGSMPGGNGGATGDGEWMAVSPGYFGVFRIPIIQGRDFNEQDDANAPKVALINQAMANKFWRNQNPIGQRIEIGKDAGPTFADTPREIIGVVGDSRDDGLDQAPEPTMIIPEAQEPDSMNALGWQFGPIYWMVRTQVEPYQVGSAVTEQLRLASGGLPVGRIHTMDETMSQSIAEQNFNMILLSTFAFCALLLAVVGLYGVMAYSVAQRTQELGIRMALGANRTDILNLILGEGLVTVILGVTGGLGAAFVLVHLIAGFLFGVETRDPLIFAVVPTVLTIVAFFAVYLPARRAARLEPLRSLRAE
jgi:putative ABC transport system permease protein